MENVVLEHYGVEQANDILLCHQVSEILEKHYAGHPWLIGANHEAGTINVQLTYLDSLGKIYKYGFQLHIKKISTYDDLQKKVMRAGGELLERWNLDRGKATSESFNLAKHNGLITQGAV